MSIGKIMGRSKQQKCSQAKDSQYHEHKQGMSHNPLILSISPYIINNPCQYMAKIILSHNQGVHHA